MQDPLPIWYGGSPTEATARRIAEFGHGWVPLFLPEDVLAGGIQKIRAAFVERGRDPESLEVRHQLFPSFDAQGQLDVEATFAPTKQLAELGVTMVNLGLGWSVREATDMQRTIEAIGKYFQ